MEQPNSRIEALRERFGQVRVKAIDGNRSLIAELTGIWRELNELGEQGADIRQLRESVAVDIARLEKLDLVFDTEWLAEAKREHQDDRD